MTQVGRGSPRHPLHGGANPALPLRWLMLGATVLVILAQSARADVLVPRWALLYRHCTDSHLTLGEVADRLFGVGWQQEKWPEHALETARQGSFVTFFPRWATGKDQVNGVILGLDQLRNPEALPSHGFALSDPQSGDRAYFYVNDGKRLCSFVSLHRQVDAVFAELGEAAPNVWGMGRDGIYRTDDLYVMVRELTPSADTLIPFDFPFRMNFFISLDVQQPENSP